MLCLAALPKARAVAVTAESLRAGENAEQIYLDGRQAYWQGDYARAVSLFSRVAAIDPGYRPNQVGLYQNLSTYRLRGRKTPGRHERYPEPIIEMRPERDVVISDEREWLYLIGEAEMVLHDAVAYVSRISATGMVAQDDLIDSRYYIRQARRAYELEQYVEVIRYSHLAREKAEAAFEKAESPERTLLGEVGDTLVTLNVSDLDLRDTLRLIYDLTGVNIVLSAGISGRVTMNVRDVPLRRVLDLVVDMHGLRYTERENVIVIMTAAEYERTGEGLRKSRRRVFALTYAESQAVAKVVRETLGLEAVTADTRSNSVIVSVADVDQAEEVEALVRQLDSPVNQVLLQAELIEVVYDDEKELGVNFLFRNRMIGDVQLSGPRFGTVPTTLPADRGVVLGLAHKDFSAIFNAIAAEGMVRLLQSPRIMAISGSSAVISVTDEYPHVQYDTRTRTIREGNITYTEEVPVPSIEIRDVGTVFEITPLIQEDRTVALSLTLTIDQIRGEKMLQQVIGDRIVEEPYPLISTRQVNQNVVLWDGETLVVGGIRNTRHTRDERRVPGFGNIPVLGHLFKRSTSRKSEAELILFLTPRIVKAHEEGRTLTREYQVLPSQAEAEQILIERRWF